MSTSLVRPAIKRKWHLTLTEVVTQTPSATSIGILDDVVTSYANSGGTGDHRGIIITVSNLAITAAR
jgi:hypothetical protein